jgi:quercetin dioxygenase-like cupin family protein
LHTQRLADTQPVAQDRGVTLRPLYRALGTRALRPGEPEAATLVELAPGTTWAGPAATSQREWLVLAGTVHMGDVRLEPHDYHVLPAGLRGGALHSAEGALLYQREAPGTPAGSGAEVWLPYTQHAAQAAWEDFGPGIKRRLMWQREGLAAMLYHALPGAAVPHHGHRHDEECLMLEGDFFLDEVLLRQLDYQVAPAGSEHVSATTDTGLLVFAHGDLELDVKG